MPIIILDTSVSDEAMQLYCPEYFDKSKPDYKWEEEENLVAYIQFDLFPEEAFRKFVRENYPHALGYEAEIGIYTRLNPNTGKNLLSGQDPEEDDNFMEDLEVNEPISSIQKFIWAEGIFFEKELPSNTGEKPQAEVTKSGKRVKIRVTGQKGAKMSMLDHVLNWFESKTKDFQPIKIIECVCDKCQSKTYQPYEIGYEHFQNLQKIFVPQIQCYASGELLRLDKISSFEQPEVRLIILHADEDSYFFDEYIKTFKQKGNYKFDIWEPRKLFQASSNRQNEAVNFAINQAHVAIFMTSVDLCGSEVIEKGIERAIERSNKGDILVKIIQLKSFDWEEHPIFQKSGISAINSEPIELAQNRAEAWQKVVRQVHREIEDWVRVLGKKAF